MAKAYIWEPHHIADGMTQNRATYISGSNEEESGDNTKYRRVYELG